MSFQDVRSALAIAHADGFLDDEEFLFLYDHYSGIILELFWNYDPFCFDVFDYCECEDHFTVAKFMR